MDKKSLNQSGSSADTLQRSLGLRECVTIIVGTVIGVGLFTVGANCAGFMGKLIILASTAALLISLWPALLYAEMGVAMPKAGGTYNYAKKGLNPFIANMAGWNYVIAIISACSGEALAFSNYTKWMFKAFHIELNIDSRIIACVLLILFIFINYRGIEIAGKWQNAFVFFFWSCSLVWFIMEFRHVNISNLIGISAYDFPGLKDFLYILGLVWWCFAGFETVVGMGGEIKYPQINIPRSMKISPFIIFAVTAIFQWFLIGIVPSSAYGILQTAEAPYAEGLVAAGIVGIPLLILCMAIAFGGDLSTINPGIGAPARYVYTMSLDGYIPSVFSRLHRKYKTPYVAIILVGSLNILLIATGSIIYIASVSLFSILFCYIIGFISYIGLRIRHKEMERPYKAPGGIFGAVISTIIYVAMISQIGQEALLTGGLLCILSIIAFAISLLYNKSNISAIYKDDDEVVTIEIPTAEEKYEIDKQYRIYKIATIVIFILALAIYIIPMIL